MEKGVAIASESEKQLEGREAELGKPITAMPVPFGDVGTEQDRAVLEPLPMDHPDFAIEDWEYTEDPIPTEPRLVPGACGSDDGLDTQSDRASPVASTYHLLKSNEFTNRFCYQSCDDRDMYFDLFDRMPNVKMPACVYPKLELDDDGNQVYRMSKSLPRMILATPGYTLYQQMPGKSNSWSSMVLAYHTPSSIARQYPQSPACDLMKQLYDKICERDLSKPNAFMFQHLSLRPNNRSPDSSKNPDGSRKTVDGSFNLTIAKIEEGVGVVAPAATTTDANVQSWIRDLADLGSKLTLETSRISRRRREHAIACADYELHNTIQPGDGKGLYHLIQMNVLTSDVSLEDGIGKESGNMHVDGNDCKLHPTMMIGATKVPPGAHRGVFVLAQYGLVIEILENIVIIWFTGVAVHGGSRTYVTREQWAALAKKALAEIWGAQGMPEGFAQFRIVLVFYSKEIITRRSGHLNLCRPSQYGHVSQGGESQSTKYNLFADHGLYLWSTRQARHTWMSRELAMSMYNMYFHFPGAIPLDPNSILQSMTFEDEEGNVKLPELFHDEMNPFVDPVSYRRWRAWILFRRMVAIMFVVPLARASLRVKLQGRGKSAGQDFGMIGRFDLSSDKTPIPGVSKILSSVEVEENDKKYLKLELEVEGKGMDEEVIAGLWMTDDQEEMLYQHLLIKVKNRIPQQQCVPLVGQGQKVRTLRNKSLALIQDASHRLIDIALQKPLDIIDQLLLSTLNDNTSNSNDPVTLHANIFDDEEFDSTEKTTLDGSAALDDYSPSTDEDEDESPSIPLKRNRLFIPSSSEEEVKKTRTRGKKKARTQNTASKESNKEEGYAQAVLNKGFNTKLLTKWLTAGRSRSVIRDHGSHFRSEAFRLRTSLTKTKLLHDKNSSTLLPTALGLSRMSASAVYLRQDSLDRSLSKHMLPHDVTVHNHLAELWAGQLMIDASVARQLYVTQDHKLIQNRVLFREQCGIDRRILHFILHESSALVVAMVDIYQSESADKLSKTFPSYSKVFLKIVNNFKLWSTQSVAERKSIVIDACMLGQWAEYASDRKLDRKISVPPLKAKIQSWKCPLQPQSLSQLQLLFEESFVGLLLANGLAPARDHITQQVSFLEHPQQRSATRWDWYQLQRHEIVMRGTLAELLIDASNGEAILSTHFAHHVVAEGSKLFQHAILTECRNPSRVIRRVLQAENGYSTLLQHFSHWYHGAVEQHADTGDHLASLSHYLDYARSMMETGKKLQIRSFGPVIHKTSLSRIERKAIHDRNPLTGLLWVEHFSKGDVLFDGMVDVLWQPLAVIVRETLRRAKGVRNGVRYSDHQSFPERVTDTTENPTASLDQVVQWILNGLDVDRRHRYDPDHTEPSRHLSLRVQLLHDILPPNVIRTNEGFSTLLVCFLSGQGDDTKVFLKSSPQIYSSAREIDMKIATFRNLHGRTLPIDNMSIWGQPNAHLRFSGQDETTPASVRMAKCFDPTTHFCWQQFLEHHGTDLPSFTDTRQFLENLKITGLGGLTSLHATNFLLDCGLTRPASVKEMGHIISRTNLGGTQGLQHMGLIAPPGNSRRTAAALAVVTCHLEDHMSADDKAVLGFVNPTSCAENYCCKIQKFIHRCYRMNGIQHFLDICKTLTQNAYHGTVSATEPDLFPFPLATSEATWERALNLINRTDLSAPQTHDNTELEAVAQMLAHPESEMTEVRMLAMEYQGQMDKDYEEGWEDSDEAMDVE